MDKSQAKKSFILYNDQRRLFQKLAKAQVGELMECIFAYADGEAPHIEDPLVDLAFEMIAAQMDRDMEKYKTICEKRSENAKKQWEQFNQAKMQVHGDAGKCMEAHASTGDNVNENENDNDNDNDNDIKDSSLVENKKITISQFDKFWKLYPKKASKGEALSRWKTICNKPSKEKPTWVQIKKAILSQKKTEQWKDPKFIPHAATWLNKNKWLDDPKEMVSFDREEKAPKKEKSTEQLTAELEKEVKAHQKCPDLSTLQDDSREYSIWTNIIPHPAKIVEKYAAWLEDQSWISQIQPGHFDFAGKTFQQWLEQANKEYGVNILTGMQ